MQNNTKNSLIFQIQSWSSDDMSGSLNSMIDRQLKQDFPDIFPNVVTEDFGDRIFITDLNSAQ